MSNYIVKGVSAREFNLDHIFDCGQCFRFAREEDGSYRGIAMGKAVTFSYCADREELTIENCCEEEFNGIWKRYLDLDRDYSSIKMWLSARDKTIGKAMEYGYGIRILNQNLWEIIVSFIISANNNIPRIKGCIENLAREFGEPLERKSRDELNGFVGVEAFEGGNSEENQRGGAGFNLPSPEKLASLTIEDLAPIKLGYRAKYLIETAKLVVANGLPENDEDLKKLVGVGPKVASCIKLFGMGDMASFPIDVWVKRVMNHLYGIDEKDMKAMAVFAREHFGEYGGIAQQYLFYFMRTGAL